MSRFHDYLRQQRKKRRDGRPVGQSSKPAYWVEGPYRAVAVCTRSADVLVIFHAFSGRVECTEVLPPGLCADLWGRNREEVCMSFLKKAQPAANGVRQGAAPPDDWGKFYPAVSEYLYAEQYPDGARRARATLTVMAGDASGVKVVLNDREESRSLWATGKDLDSCLEALEACLVADQTPWRMDKPGGGRPSPKR